MNVAKRWNVTKLGPLIGLIAVAGALLQVSTAQADYPYGWPYAAPPGWWSESLGPGGLTQSFTDPGQMVACTSTEYPPSSSSDRTSTSYPIVWGPAGVGPLANQPSCDRQWGPEGNTRCEGSASHTHFSSGASEYASNFVCFAFVSNGTLCERRQRAFAGTVEDTGWSPYDCRPQLPGWPSRPRDVIAEECLGAKTKLKKAKQAAKRSGAANAGKGARKLRRLKKLARAACVDYVPS